MITSYYELDVSPGGIPLVVYVSQYDKASRTLVFQLTSAAGELVLPTGTKAEIRGTKPDGNGFSYDAELSGTQVTVDLKEQMTAIAGKVACEIVLYTTAKELCTGNFILFVERAALDKDTLRSNSEIRQLVDVIDRTDEIIAAANKSDSARKEIQKLSSEAKTSADNAKNSETSAAESLENVNKKASEIVNVTTYADQLAAQALEKASNAENEAAEGSNTLDQLNQTVKTLQLQTDGKIDGAYTENGYLYLTSNDEIVAGPLGPFSGTGGGGSGSGGNNAVITVTNQTGWLSKTIASGDTCEVKITWSSLEDEMETGNGTMKITVNGSVKAMIDVKQGELTTDLSKYLITGSNVVKVNVSDVYGNNRTINFSISVVELSITSSFDDSTPYNGPISFSYVPVGNIKKTVYFILDGRQIGKTTTSVSGRQQSYTIRQQKHGAHMFRCYFEAEINGQIVRSNELYYEIICLETLNMTPIITSSFRETTVEQYTALHIGYTVYDPASLETDVTISVNNSVVSEQTIGRTAQDFTYRADKVGTLTIRIAVKSVYREFTVKVTKSDIEVTAETEGLVLYLSSAGRSNNEVKNKRILWKYNNIRADFQNFNYTSDGWMKDEDGTTVLRVAGDARVTIPYKIFATDCRTTGKTIEIEFATRTVMNYDSVILSCMSGGRGIELTAQKVRLKSEQSEISTQFKEEEHVRVSFVIEKKSANRLIYCYINGIMSGAIQYPAEDDFSQTNPVDISIGSNDCTMDLYCIRVYDQDLSRSQILDNWIADTQTITDMLARYRRNQVYDEYGNIVMDRLPSDLPYLVLEAEELPQYKGDKKTVSGRYVDSVNPSKSFTFTGAQLDVQGTSSQYYERKNYKGKFKKGFVMASGTTTEKYKLRDDSIPVSTFCFKADVASSEGANNVELVRLYCDACPYKTPAQKKDEKIRQGIDGFPIVIFWDDGKQTTFMGKYNFNLDKSDEEAFGFESGDESWEVSNNTSDRVLYKSADFSTDDWKNDFEARYPDTDPPYEDCTQLKEFSEWIVQTDTSAATSAALSKAVTYDGVTYTTDSKEYRLAKFKAELGRYVELDSALFYYLFTELFLMVDSRAKNMFPSFVGSEIEKEAAS